MSDYMERACGKCGSLLHHEDDCNTKKQSELASADCSDGKAHFIVRIVRRLLCPHIWEWSHNYYGDAIIHNGWNRSAWKCTHCGAAQNRRDLHYPTDTSDKLALYVAEELRKALNRQRVAGQRKDHSQYHYECGFVDALRRVSAFRNDPPNDSAETRREEPKL